MSMKMELKEENCTVCSKVFGSNSVTAVEDILDLIKCLVETINSLICTACLEKLKDAVNFQMSFLVKQEKSNAEMRRESECDEKFVTCYICNNFTKIDSAKPLFNSCYENTVCDMIPKKDLNSLDTLQICVDCHTSLLNFQNMKLFLSVYDLNKANNDQLNYEILTDHEFKIDIIDHSLPEYSELNVELKRKIKEEIEESEEHSQKKMDYETGPSSSSNFWIPNNEDQERSSTLLYPDNDSDLTTSLSKIEMEYKVSSNNLKNETNKNIHEIEMFKCQNCEFQTRYKGNLKTHLLIHKNINEIEIFKCQHCQYQTKYKYSLKRHVLIHKNVNEIDMFKCQNCQFQTRQKGNLKIHVLKHKDAEKVEIFKCHNCQYQIRQKSYLKSHTIKHKDANKVKMFKCHNCQYQTKYKSSLRWHVLIHKNVNEIDMFKCQNCQYQAIQKSNLKVHMLKHKNANEVEMFNCHNCQYQTRQKSHLKSHVLKHEDANKIEMFKCHNCQYQARQKGNLKIHMLKHKVEMLKCQNCKYQTKKASKLEGHVLIHKCINEVAMP